MISEILGLSYNQFILFFLTLVRISALLMVAPIFGSQVIPVRMKIFISLFLTLIIWPIINTQDKVVYLSFKSLISMTGKEIIIGLFLGFNAKFIFEAFQFAGRLISHQMGLAMAELINPESGAQASPVGTVFSLLTILFFLNLNGHHFIISAIYKSFEMVPIVNSNLIRPAAGEKMLSMFNEIFTTGLKLAAPAMAIIFLIEVCMGIMGRLVPQMNIFFIGLPLRLGVGLLILVALMPVLYMFFELVFKTWQRDLKDLLYLL